MLYEELRIIEEELKRIKNMGYIKNIRKKREGELARIKSSVLWKLSKPIRVIKKRGEKNEN